MVKQKNHTGRNATVKDHVNGIKKAKSYPSTSLAGMDPKFLRNLRFSKRHNKRSVKSAKK
ncbi:large subunit ribosomal protein 29 [Ochromonadaceae sp. CCMP2298]|nr:large subunit ribosomal protein 29 [Ochromonadaceae sp. CCMP2298]